MTFPRYSANALFDIIYGNSDMPTELAEAIRVLRSEHKVQYSDLGFYLSENSPDRGASHGLGRALTEIAARILNDFDPSWT